MSIKYVEGDMFGPLKSDSEPGAIVLPHCCNDRGAWGAGFVVPLGRTFPSSRQNYLDWYNGTIQKDNATGRFGLGETQFVEVQAGNGDTDYVMGGFGNEHEVKLTPRASIFVANMVAQTLGGVRPLFYNHLSRCLDAVAKFVKERSEAREHPARIIAPMFGSALAGGNWNIIENLICDSWLRQNIPVTIYYLPGTLPDNWELPK